MRERPSSLSTRVHRQRPGPRRGRPSIRVRLLRAQLAQPEAGLIAVGGTREAPPFAQAAPRAAASVLLGAASRGLSHASQAQLRRGCVERAASGPGRPRAAEPGRAAIADARASKSSQARSRARAALAARARALQVQQHRPAVAHPDVAGVQVAVCEARLVQAPHGAAHVFQQAPALRRIGGQGVQERRALQMEGGQPLRQPPRAALGKRHRLRYGDARVVQRARGPACSFCAGLRPTSRLSRARTAMGAVGPEELDHQPAGR